MLFEHLDIRGAPVLSPEVFEEAPVCGVDRPFLRVYVTKMTGDLCVQRGHAPEGAGS
jgi:hypothetical protein